MSVLWLCLWTAWMTLAHGGPIEDGFALMESGDLESATQLWEQTLSEGSGSATLHYNLGTAWYRRGDVPRAIAHWRLGRVLRPRDANLVHNLAVARSELTEVLEPVDSHPALLQVATVGEWGGLGCAVLGLASLGLWLPAVRRRLGIWPPLATGVVGTLLVIIAVRGASQLSEHPGAVVRQDGAFMRTLAARHSDVVSKLGGGTEVEVEQVHDGFALVRTSAATRGWIPLDAVFFVGQGWNQHP